MILVRSLLYVALFYLWSTVLAIAFAPLLLGPRAWMIAAMRRWTRGAVLLLRIVCGARTEIRGLEHLPPGPVLIAAKHQGMFDTIGPWAVLAAPAYVMKRELLSIPFYGWYCRKAGMIAIDREARSTALRSLVAQARDRAREGRQVVIFPEGTRVAPGAIGAYKPGVAALYRELGLACAPLATNSGRHWPAHGFLRRPGVIVYQFLEPIPPGLHRAAFMRTLEERIETASAKLLAE